MKKWSLRYELFRRVLSFAFTCYYRNVEVYGREHIPSVGPVIFCENHTNAVIDPVIIAARQSRQPGFLARSDVFRNKHLAGLFRTFKMLPVYRQRDNVNTVEANQPVFDAVVRHLVDGGSFIIAPEGDKSTDHHLLPLKKGVSRIAVQFMQSVNWQSNLCIVPVGITYSRYDRWGGDVIIRFGKPIYMRDFREEYEKAPSQIFRIITNRLAEGIRPLMWHVGEKSWLPWLFQLKKLDGVRASFKERMDWSVAQLEKLQKSDEATLQHFQTTLHNYLIKLHQKNITDRAVATVATRSRVISLLLTFLLAHFALLHVIFHLVPLRLGKWVARKMGPHPHFHASILFGLLMVILPVFYIIYFSVAWAVAGTLWPAVLLMAGLPLVARPARVWLESWQQLRVSESLVRMRSEVMSLLDKMQH